MGALTDSRRPPAWVVALASVVSVDFALASVLRPHSWPVLALSVAVFGLVTVFAVRLVVRNGSIASMVMAALWVAPLAILVTRRSIWAIPPAVFAAVAWTRAAGKTTASDSYAILPAFCAAACLQLGVMAVFDSRPMAATALLAAGAVIITWRKDADPKAWTLARSSRTIALATALTVFGLLGGSGSGGSSGAGAFSEADAGRLAANAATNLDVYRGVILWPEEQDHVTLVPPLPAMSSRLFRPNDTNPLSIPFYGVYWFFNPPSLRPPPSAVVMHGDAAEKAFRSNDETPLAMEAHQNLGRLIDLSCCRRIDVEVRNADRYSGMVGVELILFNTVFRTHQSLGVASLQSRPRFDTVSETLKFPVPAGVAIRQFDEFTIRFPRERVRSYRSAKIAIERFVLVPK